METTNPNVPADAVKGPLVFTIASLVMLCLSAVWLALNPSLLADPKISPESTAWVYLAVYGFALSGMYGLVYRAVPIILGVPLYSPQMVILNIAFHLVGLIILLPAAFNPDMPQGVMGQTFLACGAITFIVNIGASFKREERPNAPSAFLAASLLWLGIMVVVGIPFAKSPLVPFFGGSDWSPATLVLCIAGAVLNSVFGVSLRTTALRIGSGLEGSNLPWFALALLNSGAAWLFAATAFGPSEFILFCAGLYLLGVLVFLAGFTAMLQRREVETLEWDSKILYTALWMLPVSVLLFGFAVWTRQAQKDAPLSLEASALLAIVLGVCVPALMALFYQTSSLIRGDERGADAPLDVKLSAQILLAAFFNYAVGALMIIPGAWLGIEKMLGLGTLFLIVGSVGFLGIFLHMLRPKTSETRQESTQTA